MTLTDSADMFLDRLPDDYVNARDAHAAGVLAQRVQGSAFPDRYAEKWDEAHQVLARALAVDPNPGNAIATTRGPWTGDPVWLKDVLQLWDVPIIETDNWRSRGHGDFREVRGVIGHHTAGGGANDWIVVRDGRLGLAGPLAQIVLEKDGTARLICVGIAYHAGSGAGSAWAGKFTTDAKWHTIGIEAVSRGTPPWDWTSQQLDSYRKIVAAILWRLNKDSTWFCGHREYNLVDGKIDPAGIDLNVFRADVQGLIDAGPTGVAGGNPYPPTAEVTGIEAVRKENDWLGTILHPERELRCPDGLGRFAHYENGSVYFHPDVGIFAVPKALFDFWATVGWETSWLGYPKARPDVSADGVWQEFQGGNIYGRTDAKAWPCHGGILATWLRAGGVTSQYGWPQSREVARGDGENAVYHQEFERGRIVWRTSMGPIGTLDTTDRDVLDELR
ncbi:MAG: hypothetical protein EOP32_00395 [Rhodococcus sp. (in: high G+C Gram-positive bacteria)]|nr:MAG: hypothetical protein EOP32_00395 [Rhodococcus sp. (in: high G+C Gram-positive bacteria)]